MNPSNTQNIASYGPGPQGNQQAGALQKSNATQSVQQHIFRLLQQQQPPQGWRTAVTLQQRTTAVWQLVSSLRLMKPDMEIHQSVNVAVTFEQKKFYDSPDKVTYEQSYRRKLSDIAQMRNKQAGNFQSENPNLQPSQMNMTPQQAQLQGMVFNQNTRQFQPEFHNPRLHPSLQTPGLPTQQQQSHQPLMAMGNPQSLLQPMPQNPHPHVPQQHAPRGFTQEENQHINLMAQHLARTTPKEQMDLINNNINNLTMEQRQSLAMQGVEPLAYYFRNQATKKFVEARAQQAAQRSLGITGQSMMPQQARPASQNPVNLQAQVVAAPASQNFDSSFDQIMVQQQQALRSQEAGQVVVPASQGMVDQQRGNIRGTPQQQPNIQMNVGRSMPKPNQPYWNLEPPNLQQGPPTSTQPQAANFGSTPNQVPQHPLTGQLGGLNPPSGRTPQLNPNMPNLNRGLGSPNLQPQTVNVWPQQRPQINQPRSQDPSDVQRSAPLGATPTEPPGIGQQQRPRPNSNLPPQLQQHLANLPVDQRRAFIAQMQLRHHQQQLALVTQQQNNSRVPAIPESGPMREGGKQTGTQAGGGQQGANTNGQLTTVLNGSGPHQLATPNQQQSVGPQAVPPQRSQQQRDMLQLAQQKAAQVANISLTEEQARQMDRQFYPAKILQSNGALSQLPTEVKTWGQLKQWVAQNAGILPPGSLIKLRGLQGLHYQNLTAQQKPKIQQIGQGPVGQTQGQGNTQAPAPAAQMVAPRNNQTPLPGLNNPTQMSGPGMMHQLPQPTPQEIQAGRARLPEHMKGISDEQIRGLILRQRQQEVMKLGQGHSGSNQQQQLQQNSLQGAQQQQQQQQHTQQQFQTPNTQKVQGQPPPTMPPRPPQPNSKSAAPLKDSAAKQSQAIRTGQPALRNAQSNQKGVKRNSNDDVVEVPNPNIRQQASSQQAPNMNRALSGHTSNVPQHVSENTNAVTQGQRAHLDSQRQMAAQRAQPLPQNPVNPKDIKSNVAANIETQRTEEIVRREIRLKQIVSEVIKNAPKGKPVAMTPQTRDRMVQSLQKAKPLVQRMEQSLPMFFNKYADEKTTIDLVRTRVLLVSQYRDAQCNPVDQFTISSEELDSALNKLNKYFNFIVETMMRPDGNMRSQGPQPPVTPQQSQQRQGTGKAMPVLNAANLQQQQHALHVARQASVQRNQNNTTALMQRNINSSSSRTPAAPTSTQPPFSFGGQPPHGVPRVYGERPNELTQDKLQIPPTKKRKGNQTASASLTPAQVQDTPTAKSSPQIMKIESPEASRTPAPPVILQCSVPNCEANAPGFTTQADLDRHVATAHEPKEPPIDDPLEFCLESMRMALNLDRDGKAKPRLEESKGQAEATEIPKMKASTSSQGQSMVKQEVATPVAKVTTQTGPSPASNALKTPQATNAIKTPTFEIRSALREGKALDTPKATSATTKEAVVVADHDPWAESHISREVITAAFSGLANLQCLAWTDIRSTLSADSPLSSDNINAKISPRPSDISESDAVMINLEVNDRSWWPSEWFDGLGGDMEAMNMNPDMMAMDWDTDFGDFDAVLDEGTNKGDKIAKGKEKKRDESAPSPEWLRVFAPEQLDKKK